MKNDLLIRACRRQPTERTPVWMMRQAGRYMEEYRQVRAKVPFMTLCKTPELAAEVSLQPYQILGVDGVIMFSDILIPVEAMGMAVQLTEKGPELPDPIRTQEQIDKLIIPDPTEHTPYTLETIRLLRKELDGAAPLIGFAGAPWTLAAYMVEGGGSKNYAHIKGMANREPKMLASLLEKIADTITIYLNAQIEAGAQVVQLFDTWAGDLSPKDYERFALPYVQRIVEGLRREQAPVILYMNGCGDRLEKMLKSGADVLSIDWRIDLAEAKKRVGSAVALQGNVDPCILLGPREGVEQAVRETLIKGGSGHILNLGHGILPSTPVENAKAFVDAAKNFVREPEPITYVI